MHQLAEFLQSRMVGGGQQWDGSPPTFEDGLRCQQVLAALAEAAHSGRWEEV